MHSVNTAEPFPLFPLHLFFNGKVFLNYMNPRPPIGFPQFFSPSLVPTLELWEGFYTPKTGKYGSLVFAIDRKKIDLSNYIL